jgi:hypothetical protein
MSNEGFTAEEITIFVIQQALNGVGDDDNESSLVTTFNLSVEDAAWMRDRVFGGIYRAGTDLGSWFPSNKPDAKDDIFAYTSYQYVLKKPEIITSIYPFFGGKSAWWKFW